MERTSPSTARSGEENSRRAAHPASACAAETMHATPTSRFTWVNHIIKASTKDWVKCRTYRRPPPPPRAPPPPLRAPPPDGRGAALGARLAAPRLLDTRAALPPPPT